MTEPITNPPQQPNAMGGAPTTTQDVTGGITPNQPTTPTQPTTPNQPVPNQNQPTQAAMPAPAAQPATPKSLHESIYAHVLNTLRGQPMFVNRTDDQGNTTRVEVPNSRQSLGKSILAGALAGMFAPGDTQTETPFGPRFDASKAIAVGGQAGVALQNQRQAQAQQQEDQAFARKQLVMKDNIDMVHQALAMAAQNHAMLQSTVDSNQKGILASAAQYDNELSAADANDPSKKAIIGSKMNHEQALAALNGHWSDQLAVVDGVKNTRNPQTGVWEPEPLYTILNPNINLKMTKEQADDFSRYNPAYKGLADKVGEDNLKLALPRYLADTHSYNSLRQFEPIAERVQDALPDSEGLNLAALTSGKDGKAVKDAVLDVENAMAQHGDISSVLHRLQGSAGGALILKDMGITDEDINDYTNKQLAAQQELLNKNPGKKPVDPAKIQGLPALATSLGLDKPQTEAALAKVPTTVDEYDTVVKGMQDQANKNRDFAASKEKESGNPKDIDTLSDQLLQPNNLTTMRDIGTRGTQREAIIAEASRKAKARGIPFDSGLINERVDFAKSYFDPKGKDSMNRRSLNNLVQHSGNLAELNHGVESRAANTAMNAIESQFGNEAYQKFLTETAVVKDEVTNYFAGGFAPNKEQKATWDRILANEATPNQVEAFVKTIIPEAAIRLDSTAEQFKEVMGYDDPNLVYPATKAAAQKLGLDKIFAKYRSGGQLSQNLPATQPYTPVAGDRPINKGGKVVGYLSADGTRHNL